MKAQKINSDSRRKQLSQQKGTGEKPSQVTDSVLMASQKGTPKGHCDDRKTTPAKRFFFFMFTLPPHLNASV
jgi:hypothetical protein